MYIYVLYLVNLFLQKLIEGSLQILSGGVKLSRSSRICEASLQRTRIQRRVHASDRPKEK